MKQSDYLAQKLQRAELLIQAAQQMVQEVLDADERGDGFSGGAFMMKTEECIDLINQLGYEVVMPLQMEEV